MGYTVQKMTEMRYKVQSYFLLENKNLDGTEIERAKKRLTEKSDIQKSDRKKKDLKELTRKGIRK